jgi:hypothetical protein
VARVPVIRVADILLPVILPVVLIKPLDVKLVNVPTEVIFG